MPSCVYASATGGIHDQRWLDALENVGYAPIAVRLGIEASNIEELRSLVVHSADVDTPILAGPLDTVTRSLLGIPGRLIGLSWGSDLHEQLDYTWLVGLDGVIVDSQATFEIATRAGVPEARITLLPWGIDLDLFAAKGPREDLSRWHIPKGARTAITMRAHESIYRVSDVIEAFAAVIRKRQDVHLLVGNSGTLTEQLKTQTRTLGLDGNVHFIGRIAESDLGRLFRATDCYVTASEVDGTSVTLLQAMACGTPIVASNSPGNLGWIRPGITGRTYATGDTHDLAEQIIAALDNPQEQMTRAAAALVRTEANWTTNVSRLRKAVEGA